MNNHQPDPEKVSRTAENLPGKLLCRMTIPLRWGDMDALAHVNNTVFFRLIEEIRVAWFARMGQTLEFAHAQGPVVVNASMTFLRQMHYPDPILVSMAGADPGRSSFDTHYALADANDPKRLYGQGAARCVWVDFSSGKSHPLPQVLRDAILNPDPILITP